MPKKTNPFQQLVTMIYRVYAPRGAKITESNMDYGNEIDVLIECDECLFRLVAVEAKDEADPLDVNVVNHYIGKYLAVGGIPVNKVTIASSSGFTKGARKRAESYPDQLELVTIDEVKESEWAKYLPKNVTFRVQPLIYDVSLSPPVVKVANSDPLEGRLICNCCGADKGSPLQWAEWYLRTQVLPNRDLLLYFDEQAQKQPNGQILVSVPWPTKNYTLLYQGQRHPVDNLKVDVVYACASSPLTCSTYRITSDKQPPQTVDHQEAIVGQQRIQLLMPDGLRSKQISFRMDAVVDPPCQTTAPAGGNFQSTFNALPATFSPKDLPPARLAKYMMISPNGAKRPKSKKRRGPNWVDAKKVGKVRAGANDLCPCGSGKKYKKCCRRKDMM
jgi:hypothetical protein